MNYRQHMKCHAIRNSYYESPIKEKKAPKGTPFVGFLSNKYIPPRKSQDFAHVLALELLRLSM